MKRIIAVLLALLLLAAPACAANEAAFEDVPSHAWYAEAAQALREMGLMNGVDAGDIILFQGKQFVIYYDANSWSLTPLAKITGMTKAELRALLGSGSVTAVLSLGK